MTTTNTALKSTSLNLTDSVAIFSAMAFGLFLVIATNFSSMTTAHNAAHDTRHSIGFPCH